jgi:hypothetical protein
MNIGSMEMLHTPLAWHVALCFIATSIGGSYMIGMYKVYGQSVLGEGSEIFLSRVGGIALLFNAAGRIGWGALGDRIGSIESLILMAPILTIVLMT